MRVTTLLIILMAVSVPTVFSMFHYCHIPTCRNYTHTLCRFRRNTASENCRRVRVKGLTDPEKDRIVELHNAFRFQVYSGMEFRGFPGPQPPSTNNSIMEWDDELAKIAQRWANQCSFRHDTCRNVDRFNVSQNIAQRSTFGGAQLLTVDWYVRLWYEEVVNYRRQDVQRYNKELARALGSVNYSQMVWANSTKIGCGGIRYYDVTTKFLLVCNYGSAGNIDGEPVYDTYAEN